MSNTITANANPFLLIFLCFDVDLKITVVLLWRYVEIGSWKCGSCLAIRGNRFLEIGSWKCGACLVIHQNNVEVGSRMLSTLVTTFTDLNVNVRYFFVFTFHIDQMTDVLTPD